MKRSGLHDMHQAVGDATRAREIRGLMTERLRLVVDEMPARAHESERAGGGVAVLAPDLQAVRKRIDAQRGTQPGSPLPTPLERLTEVPRETQRAQKDDRGR